ncbi:MAG: outer membrane protein assembly factor [Bryobacteraceae bacterium]|nr:outer membrane protein assembly factor [Bryobacteraceae bacterium]
MRVVLLACLLFAPLWFTPIWAQDLNVNSKYIVETVEFRYARKPNAIAKPAPETQQLADREVGQNFQPDRFDGIVRRLKAEYRSYKVTHRTEKGTKPDHVKVIFELERRGIELNAESNDFKFIYSSRNNFSFGATADFNIGKQGGLLLGALTDNDLTVERTSGIRAGYRYDVLNRHVRLAIVGESFRAQWDPATQTALRSQPDVPGIYRRRQSVEPTVTIQVLPSLRLKAGVNLQRIETQFPAARFESSHALISSLRYEQGWDLGTTMRNLVGAGYDLRAAASSLGSDFVYTRHAFDVNESLTLTRRQALLLNFAAGTIGGQAPLFERFVLGNTQTLRGWNRFDVAPLGGNRMAHGSAEYRVRGVRLLYDRGAVWTSGHEVKVRQSAGIGYIKEGLTCMLAFPLREGHITPIILLGYTF